MAIIDLRTASTKKVVDRAVPAPGRENDPAMQELAESINRALGWDRAPVSKVA